MLGRTYAEVWSDPEKLTLYNAIFPPDEHGKTRAFGFFSGLENEMAGVVDHELAAPTTRSAAIIDLGPP